jgi:hypothetical protein
MTDSIPVFVNGRRVMLPRGGTASMAAALGESEATVTITDARGLPVAPDAVLTAGAILRVAPSARRAAGDSGADADA